MAGEAKKKRQRRIFTDEFKAGAVRLVLDEGKTVSQVARDLELTQSAVRMWVERARADRGKGRPGVLTTAEKEELAKLAERTASFGWSGTLLPSTSRRRRLGLDEFWRARRRAAVKTRRPRTAKSRRGLRVLGCGGGISALKQTVLLAVSSEVSPVRGMSSSEGLVQVSEPRLLFAP